MTADSEAVIYMVNSLFECSVRCARARKASDFAARCAMRAMINVAMHQAKSSDNPCLLHDVHGQGATQHGTSQ